VAPDRQRRFTASGQSVYSRGMAVTRDQAPATGGPTFDSTSPASGEVVGTFPVHGPDGLREFSRAKAITRQRFPLPFSILSFDRPARLLPAVERAMKLRHASRPRR
jgi:hypothetical protein